MLPIDSKTGKPWDHVNANAKLREIKVGAVMQLRARDKSRGIPEDGKMYEEVETDPENPGKRSKVIVPLARLANIVRSTGRDLVLLIKHRWAEFISIPQDQAAFALETGSTMQKINLKVAKKAAADVESSLEVKTTGARGQGMR